MPQVGVFEVEGKSKKMKRNLHHAHIRGEEYSEKKEVEIAENNYFALTAKKKKEKIFAGIFARNYFLKSTRDVHDHLKMPDCFCACVCLGVTSVYRLFACVVCSNTIREKTK